MNFYLADYLRAQNEWSARTFPNQTPLSVIAHVRLELLEIREHPHDIIEWIDVAILAFKGAYLTGHQPITITDALGGALSTPHPWCPISDILRGIERDLKRLERLPFLIPLWIRIAVFAFQGAFQQGYTIEQVLEALQYKQRIIFTRKWRIPKNPNEPILHVEEE